MTNQWNSMTTPAGGTGWMGQHTNNVQFSQLVEMIDYLSGLAVSKIAGIRSKKSAMSIADMFDLQMSMNKLTQFSEMSTSVVSGVNSAQNSIVRNISGR